MPRQKLTRKPPSQPGRKGQIQKPGPHDPEHQEGGVDEGKLPEHPGDHVDNAGKTRKEGRLNIPKDGRL
jgi:hypothetical protein